MSHIYTTHSWTRTKGEPSVGSEVRIYGLVRRGLELTLAILEKVVADDEPYATSCATDREASEPEKSWIGRLHNGGRPLTNFNGAPCAEDNDHIRAVAQRGRNLALSLRTDRGA